MDESIDNPILNPPYEQPDQHFEIGTNGPTGQIKDGRRPSESFIPIAITRKGRRGLLGTRPSSANRNVCGCVSPIGFPPTMHAS